MILETPKYRIQDEGETKKIILNGTKTRGEIYQPSKEHILKECNRLQT